MFTDSTNETNIKDDFNRNNINHYPEYLLDYIKELNKLNKEFYNLEYIISEEDIIFLLNVLEEDVIQFKENDSSELYISVDNADNLNIYIDILNIKNKCRVGLEVPSSEKFSTEVIEFYKILSSLNSIKLCLFSDKSLYIKELYIYKNDIKNMKNWINDNTKETETYEFNNNYKDIPEGYLIPQKTDTLFWFVSKVTDEILDLIKENTTNLAFKADIFEGELVLYLSKDKNLISVLQLADNIIDDSIREDFKILVKQDYVSILLNSNNSPDSNIVNINIEIDNSTKERLKYYMTI